MLQWPIVRQDQCQETRDRCKSKSHQPHFVVANENVEQKVCQNRAQSSAKCVTASKLSNAAVDPTWSDHSDH